MLIDVNKWIDKNGSFDEAGGLDLVRHGYEWIRRMRKFENKADRHTFQKVFGNKRGNELWDCFLEVGRSIFILEDSYFLINDRNVFSLCLAECSDYDLYELVHNIDTEMSWVALPVEPAYMGRRSGKARRPLMPVGLAKIILEEMEGKDHGESS